MNRQPTYREFPAPWTFIQRQLNEKKVVEVYHAVARADSHGAALHAAMVEGRQLGFSDAAVSQMIEGPKVCPVCEDSACETKSMKCGR